MVVAPSGIATWPGLADRRDVAVLDHERLIVTRGAPGAVDHAGVGQRHDRGVDVDERAYGRRRAGGGCARQRGCRTQRRRNRTARVGPSILLAINGEDEPLHAGMS